MAVDADGKPPDAPTTGEAKAAVDIDFAESAELFTGKHHAPAGAAPQPGVGMARSHSARRNAMTYRRFATLAEAVRFAIEDLPVEGLAATVLETDSDRFDPDAIRALYARAEFPLRRRAPR